MRRRFLDSEISQSSPAYYNGLAQYNHLLTQRNALLKKIKEHKAKANMLEAWDAQLVKSAGQIVAKRTETVKKRAGAFRGGD